MERVSDCSWPIQNGTIVIRFLMGFGGIECKRSKKLKRVSRDAMCSGTGVIRYVRRNANVTTR